MKPQRKCIGCNTVKDKSDLIRVVFNGTDLIIDQKQKLEGRGCYLCNTGKCLDLAIKKRAFGRTLRKEISSEHIGRCFND